MPKGYTFVDVNQPLNPTATAVGGGSLLPNTTYYYRVMKVSTGSASQEYWQGKSKVSAQFSVTTTATDLTARIVFNCPAQSGYSYRIWRSTSPTGIGAWSLGHLSVYPTDALHNSGGVVTFDDTGTTATRGNNFCELEDQAHGVLTLSGSTSSDMFSIVDLYNADVANGWGVIQRLNSRTYKVNCYLLGHNNLYWKDTNKTILFTGGVEFNYGASVLQFGEVSGSNRTQNGCELIWMTSWLAGCSFPTLNAYRTLFKYEIYPALLPVAGLGLSGIAIAAGTIQDCQIEKMRGFTPTTGVVLKDCIFSNFDNLFGAGNATYSGIKALAGSRIWQIGTTNTNRTGRNVYSENTYAVLVFATNETSSLTTIDSIISQGILVNSASTGFRWYDKFSYNAKILDMAGNAINGASLKIYDKDNALVVDASSDASGVVTEQLITRRYFEVSGTSVLPENNRNPFTIVVSKSGYETYKEVVSYTASNAIVKTISLKPTIPMMVSTDGKYFAKLNPENIENNRGVIIDL